MSPKPASVKRFSSDVATKGAVNLISADTRHAKAVMVTASNTQEVTMRLVTKFELAAKSTYQLHGLRQEAYIQLIKSNAYTIQRTNALASLQNIENELVSRVLRP